MKLASVPRADPYEAMEILLWCRYMYQSTMALNIFINKHTFALEHGIWSPHDSNVNQIQIKIKFSMRDTKNQSRYRKEKDTRQAVVCVGKDRVFTLLLILRLVATLPPLKSPLLKPVNIQANLMCGLLLDQQEIYCQDISCFDYLDQGNYFLSFT